MSVNEHPATSPADDDDSSISDILDLRNDEGWEDVEADHIDDTFVSLFDGETFPKLTDMLTHCKEKYAFDVWQLQRLHDLDFLGLVRLVNYVRGQVKLGNKQPDLTSKSTFDDELYLLPVLEDDAVLYNLEDVLQTSSRSVTTEVDELREQLASLQTQFTAYKEDVQKYLSTDLKEARDDTSALPKISETAAPLSLDDDYFKSYSYNSIHESMLKDKIRTDAYRDFIYDRKDVFKDKVVLDVGCGTGILSMFCIKAGAKQVIAVDNSDIIEKAKQNFTDNKLDDRITAIRGKIEEVSLPVDKVDVIVSEWMGYCLLYESMLDSVLYARDRYLAPDGLMAPSHVTIRLAPLADSDLRISYIDFWKDVYGFNMTSMLEKAEQEVLIRVIEDRDLASDSTVVLQLDLHTAKVEDLDFTSTFELKVNQGSSILEGFVLWFDTFFLPSRSARFSADMTVHEAQEKGIVAFSTGPSTAPTHWQQGICLIKDPATKLTVEEIIEGRIQFKKQISSHRSLNIDIHWKTAGGSQGPQRWFLQ